MYVTYEDIRKNSQIIIDDENEYTHILLYKKWRFFYSLKGEYSPLDIIDSQKSGIPDYVELMLYKFETAKILLEKSFGLKDPLKEGFFYEKGAKFIDIFIRDIPREHGIASGVVYDEDIKSLKNSLYEGKSLRITIHRNLIKKTATPIHELFHIFQYSYTHFNNMWFMEGLARWSQSIMQEKTGICEPLPQNNEELDILVHKFHDAEFFFNQLISLCETKHTFVIPNELINNSEIYNNKKAGSTFMKLFLQNCEKEYLNMEESLSNREINKSDYWDRSDKRSANNNKYIFRAIIDTVNSLVKNKSEELEIFLNLIKPIANEIPEDFNTKPIQEFLKVIKKYIPNIVLEDKKGILYSEHFDVFTSTISYNLDFSNSELSSLELINFYILKRINGSLLIKNCENITSLNGLDNLLTIEGNLIISNLATKNLSGFNSLQKVNKLHISLMDNLTNISGFNELATIKSELSINTNNILKNINGFSSLIDIGNIEINTNILENCDFLANTFRNNKIFKGYVKISKTNIEDVRFMNLVEKINSSFFLHQNSIISLDGLDNLKYVGGSLSLSNNNLSSLKPLSKLQEINGVLAITYNNLTSLEGLENLKSLITKKWGNIYFTIKIYGNKFLNDISALKNIETKDNYLVLYYDSKNNYIKKPEVTSPFHKNILELHDYKSKEIIPTYKFVKKESHDYKNFRLTTHNKILNVLFDFEINNVETLVLSFTGAYGNLGGLFYNKYPLIVDELNTHKIFIMDPSNSWYNKGIHPFTKNMDENIKFIQKLILGKKYKKVICMGASMGAYLGLILGCCLENEIDEVLAFSPQIFMDDKNRKKVQDKRWSSLIEKFPKNIKEEYLDLKILFEKYNNKKTKFNIHYGKKEILDNAHIEHFVKQDNINIVEYNVDDHYITIMLHKQNKLNEIILKSLKE